MKERIMKMKSNIDQIKNNNLQVSYVPKFMNICQIISVLGKEGRYEVFRCSRTKCSIYALH